MTLRHTGEETLLALVRRAFTADRPALQVDIGDDGAVYATDEARQIAVADAMIEDVHFTRAYCPARMVGYKLMAVNVSDVAAMGGLARQALFTAALPADLPLSWAEGLIDGLATAAREFGVAVAGGDITGSPGPIALSLSVLGVPAGEGAVLRSGAQPGDRVYVTGLLGAAALGHQLLREGRADVNEDAVTAFLAPRPHAEVGAMLGRWGHCHAMMDISDGLAKDAGRMAHASGATLELSLDKLPLVGGGRGDALVRALYGGEDYQLLFACSALPPLPMLPIGRVVQGPGQVRWLRNGVEAAPPDASAFDHFA